VKAGTNEKKKLIAAVVLMVLAIVLVVFRFFPSSASSAAPPPSVTTAAETSAPARPARPGKSSGGKKLNVAPAPRSLDPTLRYDWLRASEETKYEGAGRNIFQVQVEIPQPVAPVVQQQQVAQGPPQPPPPPPINLKFFGFASRTGETKKIFLSTGEDVFIASEGDIVNRRYKIVRISPQSVEIEDVLNNNRQSIPLSPS
jgi:hypothetical protein